METLGVRMEKHISNTRSVIEFLNGNDAVAGVAHPDLPGHKDHALANDLYPKGTSAVFTFEIKGGREAGIAFVNGLNLFSHLANVGDAKSLVIHPASTTHFRMDEAALAAAGIGEGTIRLSIGLEDPMDLIADLKAGLRAAEKVAGGRG